MSGQHRRNWWALNSYPWWHAFRGHEMTTTTRHSLPGWGRYDCHDCNLYWFTPEIKR